MSLSGGDASNMLVPTLTKKPTPVSPSFDAVEEKAGSIDEKRSTPDQVNVTEETLDTASEVVHVGSFIVLCLRLANLFLT